MKVDNAKSHAVKTIGLVVRGEVPEAVQLACRVVEWCHSNGYEVIGSQETAKDCSVKLDRVIPEPELVSQADPIVTLGGDGTLIGVARHVREQNPVLLGVNFGTLGFLTEIAPEECLETLEDVIHSRALLGKRDMLLASVFRGGRELFSCQGVNEALVQKGTRDRLLTLKLFIDEQPIMLLKGDGLITATPTGSTAYSLAAGGSIVHPEISALLLSPVCPHSLTARPLILPSEKKVSLEIPRDYDGSVFLLVDGQESFSLEPGDEVRVTRSPREVTFVQSKRKSYFEILRTKLRWGVRNVEKESSEIV